MRSFFPALIIAPIALSAVGLAVFALWREVGHVWGLAAGLPFLALSLGFTRHTLRRFAAERSLPLSPPASYAVTILLSLITMVAIARALGA